MTLAPTWVRFVEVPPGVGERARTTCRWRVEATAGDGVQLGQIAWYSPWRAYAFFPNPGTLFELEDGTRVFPSLGDTWALNPTTEDTMAETPQEHIIQFFEFKHLPPALQAVSEPFAILANSLLSLPRNPERTVALRKLLEAKDAAVRAALAQ